MRADDLMDVLAARFKAFSVTMSKEKMGLAVGEEP